MGSYGKFYVAEDLQESNRRVLVKISKDLEMNKQEYQILKKLKINDQTVHNFPDVYGGGEFIINDPVTSMNASRPVNAEEMARHSFIVMENLG